MSSEINGPANQNPTPDGPEGEPVGGASSDRGPKKPDDKDLKPVPGPGAPMIPDHQNIDSNPIDPRVF